MQTQFSVFQYSLIIIFFLIVIAIIVGAFIRLYVKVTTIKFNSNVDLHGKTILITGASSGIGRATTRYMCKKGARVIMACRSMKIAKIVRDEIAAESENFEVIVHYVDLSSFQSVRNFCAKVLETEKKIDVLIHNAGYGGVLWRQISTDGIEYTMATNHYGPFLMTNLLIDLLKKSSARIVVVSSKSHTRSSLDPANETSLNPVGHWFPLKIYSNSKLSNVLFTFELSRRLEGTGATVNVLHPGVVDTDIWRYWPFPVNVLIFIFKIFLRTVEEGIQTILYIALSSDMAKVSGKYFRNCRVAKHSEKADNVEWQKLLWENSKRIVGLTDADVQI